MHSSFLLGACLLFCMHSCKCASMQMSTRIGVQKMGGLCYAVRCHRSSFSLSEQIKIPGSQFSLALD